MDPNRCLEELLQCLMGEQREDAVERLNALADWLEGGGFFPYVESRQMLVDGTKRSFQTVWCAGMVPG